jgi:hypothetical protein
MCQELPLFAFVYICLLLLLLLLLSIFTGRNIVQIAGIFIAPVNLHSAVSVGNTVPLTTTVSWGIDRLYRPILSK